MKFKLITGSHADLERSYNAGDIIESEINLVEAFGPKFEVVHGQTEAPKAEEPKEDKEPVDNDVTDDFELSHDVQVVKRKRKYFIISDGVELNEKGLTKREVPAFVSDTFDDQ